MMSWGKPILSREKVLISVSNISWTSAAHAPSRFNKGCARIAPRAGCEEGLPASVQAAPSYKPALVQGKDQEMKWRTRSKRLAVPGQEVVETAAGLNQSQVENLCKSQENYTKQKQNNNRKNKQANEATEEMHFNAATFNKSLSKGSRGELRKQIYLRPKGCHRH